MIFASNKSRPYHFGPYPLERTERDDKVLGAEIERAAVSRADAPLPAGDAFGAAIDKYHRIFDSLRGDDVAATRAPVPDDLGRRSVDIKGSAYFLNASMVGICEMPATAWLAGSAPLPHSHAIVVLVEHGRSAENGSLANAWLANSVAALARFRAYEVAISVANHIQAMGYSAVAHDSRSGDVDLDRLTVIAGLGYREDAQVLNPYLGDRFAACVVTTDYPLATDRPLKPSAARKAKNLAYWLGFGGAVSGLERRRQDRRPTHLSKFPMETVRRVDQPTTLILDKEVPRVPKRASFFDRAVHGDLGKKTQRERSRFAFKHPLAAAMLAQIKAMVPHQDGPVAE
jgi:hypothetical protein